LIQAAASSQSSSTRCPICSGQLSISLGRGEQRVACDHISYDQERDAAYRAIRAVSPHPP
jgi:hypothetical protein